MKRLPAILAFVGLFVLAFVFALYGNLLNGLHVEVTEMRGYLNNVSNRQMENERKVMRLYVTPSVAVKPTLSIRKR